ncbi:hypothetical Protein YC6258_05480 [Gynuella sunshinyii YC6258]|uniref:Uncharacterized protein n=1 Tax=Gynuella sunshinyii YC6258 TaxID=1445510 RepID=A0A0C5VW03_9GAMM|nr:hypothetical Protein YC6258_05480 [Gynuella sunshinyii YC6258]
MHFSPLTFRAQPPFDDEIFYYRGPQHNETVLKTELAELLRFMDSEMQLTNLLLAEQSHE